MNDTKFDHIRIVLVKPSHPGNIGATARAMANMGLSKLYLVSPKAFPHTEATARAAGADQLLAHTVCTLDLKEALLGCELVIGTSARKRNLPWSLLTPRQCSEIVLQEPHETALLFGSERTGLTNDELAHCHYHVCIPCDPHFSSLNLAAAVQIIVYELYLASLMPTIEKTQFDRLATTEAVYGFYDHLERVLRQIEFLQAGQDQTMLLRIRRLFSRAKLEKTEINILRGILKAIEEHL